MVGSMKTQTRVRVRARGNGRPNLLALRRDHWGAKTKKRVRRGVRV